MTTDLYIGLARNRPAHSLLGAGSDIPTVNDVRAACEAGQLVAVGVNNNAYVTTLYGQSVFIRERTVDHGPYLQTFAGERFVADLFAESLVVNIPRLHAVVVDECRLERYAVFDAIEGSPLTWGSDDITALANVLATIHDVRGTGLGDVRGPFHYGEPGAFIDAVLQAEISRVEYGSPMDSVLRPLRKGFDVSPVFSGEPTCLCHGDVHRDNFMRDTSGRLWALDWEAAKYRVAAADFNQLRNGWLDAAGQDELLRTYAEIRGRYIIDFSRQIAILTLLWHVRTYNFFTAVKGVSPDDDALRVHTRGVASELAAMSSR